MSKRGEIAFLLDIKEAIRRITVYVENMSYKKFIDDIKTQDAVVRNLEIIGEATKNLSDELIAKYSKIPWSNMAKGRDRLIHYYFGVNYDIVWDIITREFPEIIQEIEMILKAYFEKEEI